jgi:hypothetical protein
MYQKAVQLSCINETILHKGNPVMKLLSIIHELTDLLCVNCQSKIAINTANYGFKRCRLENESRYSSYHLDRRAL